MDAKKTGLFKELLESKRREIAGECEARRRDGLSTQGDGPMDVGDEASQSYERQVSLEISQNERETLRLIDDALDRLKRGEYGICSNCGESITDARLKAVPYTELCLQCKSDEESQNR